MKEFVIRRTNIQFEVDIGRFSMLEILGLIVIFGQPVWEQTFFRVQCGDFSMSQTNNFTNNQVSTKHHAPAGTSNTGWGCG